ncbi:MAG TPA: ATP-grasp domain-containing protein [Bryobacteraceae bacterium]|nr:ATP-grasp domain-containing protein [Bryobacteraceae bacterium]
MRKTLHILGAGQWQVPTIRLAKQLGYRVFVTDMYAERPGYQLADNFAVVDISDRDATLRAAREQHVNGIVCDTTDVGVPTMAWVADQMGLAGIGYETALNFTNKYRMRSITSAAGLPNPPYKLARKLSEAYRASSAIGWPVVVKPTDNQSSRGVRIVACPSQLEWAFSEAVRQSRTGDVLVEGFLEGTEVTVESFCCDGTVHVAGISDKDHFAQRPEVASRLTYPADFDPIVLERIEQVNRNVIRALGLKTGICHAEYIVVGAQPYLVEIAARGAGSRVYSHIVPYLSGAPVPQAYLRFAVGEDMQIKANKDSSRAANLAFFCFRPGRVQSIEGLEKAAQLPGVEEILLEFAAGDILREPTDDRSRPGLALVFGKTREEVLATTAAVFQAVQVRTI